MIANTMFTKNRFFIVLISLIFLFLPALHAQEFGTPKVESFTLVNADTDEGRLISVVARISCWFNASNPRSVGFNKLQVDSKEY